MAERLGFDWDETFTLGRARAGLNAYSKRRRSRPLLESTFIFLRPSCELRNATRLDSRQQAGGERSRSPWGEACLSPGLARPQGGRSGDAPQAPPQGSWPVRKGGGRRFPTENERKSAEGWPGHVARGIVTGWPRRRAAARYSPSVGAHRARSGFAARTRQKILFQTFRNNLIECIDVNRFWRPRLHFPNGVAAFDSFATQF